MEKIKSSTNRINKLIEEIKAYYVACRTIKNIDECSPLVKLIIEWCIDDNGINILYKNNGVERYLDFKLYKMIARCVHNHTPQAQLERKEFSKYIVSNKNISKTECIINIDTLPLYTGDTPVRPL